MEGAAWRQGVTSLYEDYGKPRLTPSPTSDLEMLTWIPTSMSQWIISWIIGRRKIWIMTVSTDMRNGEFFSVFPLSGWNS